MASLKHWERLEEFKIRQAACLWIGAIPGSSWVIDKEQHPEAVPIFEVLSQAWCSGKFGEGPLVAVDRLVGTEETIAERPLSRKALEGFALDVGEFPEFLFSFQQDHTATSDGNSSTATVSLAEETTPLPNAAGGPLKTVIETIYAKRVTETRKEKNRRPTFDEDEVWRKAEGISRPRLRELRKGTSSPDEKKGGTPKHQKEE